jgi:hypothetical protein
LVVAAGAERPPVAVATTTSAGTSAAAASKTLRMCEKPSVDADPIERRAYHAPLPHFSSESDPEAQ